MTEITDVKLEEACTILFGDAFAVEQATLDYLQISGIKQAYRAKVKECHPDLSGNNPESQEDFIKLKDAYDFLVSVKSENNEVNAELASQKAKKPRFIPNRRVKLGEYLYYTEKISWEELISAITWQRQNSTEENKTPFGFYFIKNGILTNSELGFAIFKMKIHNSNY
ncbi:MAG: J domain-containing protein [Spirochaetales bacterium]|nr:J domain-containing protein [Spirochaetales bacterium]